MADGVAGVDMATVLLDVSRDTRPPGGAEWIGEPRPRAGRLLCEAISEQAAVPVQMATATATALLRPAELRRRAGDLGQALRGDEPWPARFAFDAEPSNRTGTHLDVRSPAARPRSRPPGAVVGATANDVVLTAVAGGLRSLLLARGEQLPGTELSCTIVVPVSPRDFEESGTLGNEVGALLLPLPVGVGDPLRPGCGRSHRSRAR